MKRGVMGVDALNQRIQREMRAGADSIQMGYQKFCLGDRVMHTRNNYGFLMMRNGKLTQGVFNGERGVIVKIDHANERLVVQFDDGSLGGYEQDTVNQLTLAYATTVHKCQGSEAPCVIMGYCWGDFVLLNRNLFYTGETRAKKEFHMIGEEKEKFGRMCSAFDIAVGKIDDKKRNTTLKERIQGRI